MLEARPLNLAIVSDVLWRGLRESMLDPALATIFGLALMLSVLSGFLWDVRPDGPGWSAILERTKMTLPTVAVKIFASTPYFIFLAALGFWVSLRPGARPYHSGRAALKVSFIAGIPVILVGLLLLIGVLRPTTDVLQHRPLTPLEVIAAPLFSLPSAWAWGVFGGLLGRSLSRFRRGDLRVE
jgi:hypothetical protein